jgi:hypothetical protein
MKKLIFIIVLLSPILINAQPDVVKIPLLNQDEHTTVAIDQNNLLLFYKIRVASDNQDSLFYIRSTDAGLSWSPPNFIQLINLVTVNYPIYPTSIRLSTGRILVGWTVYASGMYIIYSDDNGQTWSQPYLTLGTSQGAVRKQSICLQFSEKQNGEVYLSFVNSGRTIAAFKRSFDNGATWEDTPIDYLKWNLIFQFQPIDAQLAHAGNSLLTVYQGKYSNINSSFGIYSKISTDNGVTWSDSTLIANTIKNETRPRLIKTTDGILWVIYQYEDTLRVGSWKKVVNDIYYSKSLDNGTSWIEPVRLTKYINDDSYISACEYGSHPYVTFRTERFSPSPSIYYDSFFYLASLIPEVTVENFTPPMLISYQIGFVSVRDSVTTFTISAIDDDSILKVVLKLIGGSDLELFDDGNHEDGSANDNVYGNIVPLGSFNENDKDMMDVNRVKLPVSNDGVLSNLQFFRTFADSIIISDNNQNTIYLAYDFSASSYGSGYDESGFIFSGGFLMSGYSNGALWANGQATTSIVENYMPGKVGSDPNDPVNKLYRIYADDLPFGSSWQEWKNAVSIGADFYDGDEDGIYDPVDKNFNGIWDPTEDMPDLLGDKTLWCVFNDSKINRTRYQGIEPQGIEIQQTVFASSGFELENIIFFRYRIINRGTVADVLDSVIVSLWNDADIGLDYSADLVGCDTLLQSQFVYKANDDVAYGVNPPSFFTTLLQGPVVFSDASDTAYVNSGPQIGSEILLGMKNIKISSATSYISSDPLRGDPNDEVECRNYNLGLQKTGVILNPCSPDAWSHIVGGINCNEINPLFWYSGDPVNQIGWLFIRGTDIRQMLNVGPFNLVKNEPVDIVFAYALGRGTDRLNSVTVARENVQRAIQEYQSNFSSLAYDPGKPNFVIDNYELFQNYPNPFNPTTTIRYDVLADGIVTLKVYDILGQEVRTLVNEFKPARRYEVNFNSKGLASGVYIYRLQVNGFDQSKKMIILK